MTIFCIESDSLVNRAFAELIISADISTPVTWAFFNLAVSKVQNPSIEKKPFEFPMLQVDLDTINNYIVTGQNENEVVHEWTKIYYHRIWDKPNSQIEYVINKLKNEKYPAGEVQISMWDKNIDQNSKISPCTQILWFRIKNQKLEIHVHAHSSDAYKKLLMI